MDDEHPECLGPPSDFRADPPLADETECRAREVAPEQLGARPAVAPTPVAYEAVSCDEMSPAGEDQGEREVGDCGIEDTRRVRDRNPALAARTDVHVVVAHAVVRDKAEIGQEL